MPGVITFDLEKKSLFNQGEANVAISKVTEINNLHSFICH